MPPSAAATLPRTLRVAVECAPFSAPNSSLSIKPSGIAAQLTATNGLPARAPLFAIARARAVLPVPEGPVISTSTSSGATSDAACSTRASARVRPIRSAHGKRSADFCGVIGRADGAVASRASDPRPSRAAVRTAPRDRDREGRTSRVAFDPADIRRRSAAYRSVRTTPLRSRCAAHSRDPRTARRLERTASRRCGPPAIDRAMMPCETERANRFDVVAIEPVAAPEPLVGVFVVELEIRGGRTRDVDDQRERFVEQRLDLVLCTELEQSSIERMLARVIRSSMSRVHRTIMGDRPSSHLRQKTGKAGCPLGRTIPRSLETALFRHPPRGTHIAGTRSSWVCCITCSFSTGMGGGVRVSDRTRV